MLERIDSAHYGRFTLVEVRIETGRTHQIRVHLQALGHPVVGDTLYGAPHSFGRAPDVLSLDRNFLHAARLVFQHPKTRKIMTMTSTLSPELQRLLETLRADKRSA